MKNRRDGGGPDPADVLGSAIEVFTHIAGKFVGDAFRAGRESVEQHGDGLERLKVYERFGGFLVDHYDLSPDNAYQTAIHLAGQGDDVAAQVPTPPQEVVEPIQKSLLLARLEYLAEGHVFTRRISFWTLTGSEKVARHSISEAIRWDELPSEVRADWQRSDKSPQVFRLYGKEN